MAVRYLTKDGLDITNRLDSVLAIDKDGGEVLLTLKDGRTIQSAILTVGFRYPDMLKVLNLNNREI